MWVVDSKLIHVVCSMLWKEVRAKGLWLRPGRWRSPKWLLRQRVGLYDFIILAHVKTKTCLCFSIVLIIWCACLLNSLLSEEIWSARPWPCWNYVDRPTVRYRGWGVRLPLAIFHFFQPVQLLLTFLFVSLDADQTRN